VSLPTWHRLSWVPLAFLLAACTHTDLGINAPGHVDLKQSPTKLETPALETPEDPGERMILLGYGGFAGAGFQMEGPFPQALVHGSYAVGPEISVGYGWLETSHIEDEPLAGSGVLPEHAVDLNLGWIALSPLGRGVGPLYAEVEYRFRGLFGFAGGWTWDPKDRTYGPQATFNLGFLYARWTVEVNLGSQVTLGLVIKGEHGIVWSR
jgi:hypothetical protein